MNYVGDCCGLFLNCYVEANPKNLIIQDPRCSDCNVGNLETLGLDVEILQGNIPDWSHTWCHLEVLGLSSFLIGHTPAVTSREEGRGCSIKEGGGEEVLYEEGRRGTSEWEYANHSMGMSASISSYSRNLLACSEPG